MLIYALVPAKNEEEAVTGARKVFEQLCENSCPFDYYTTFDGPGTEVSGKVRWGDLPAALLAESDDGKHWIEWGLEATKIEFVEYVSGLRKRLKEFSDEELFEERDGLDGFQGAFRHYCRQLGKKRATHIWLYASNREDAAEGIVNHRELERALKGTFGPDAQEDETKRKTDLKVWVVPADVHH
jgi:hypothetical protein